MKELFESHDGNLYDTTRDNWANNPLRIDHKKHYTKIDNGRQLRATLRAGAFTHVGLYELQFITSDGAQLCFDCVRTELYQVLYSIRNEINDGWRVVGCQLVVTNGEDEFCEHCNYVFNQM